MVSNKPPLDPIIVSIGGREHSRWSRYEIDSDMFVPADDWQVTLAIPQTAPDAPLALWQKAVVRVGDDVVLTGRIAQIRRRTGKGERQLTISGRDMAGVLCDCSAPIFTAKNVSLETVVSTIARAFGLSRVKIAANGIREKVNIEPGMKAWDAIALACETNGCHAWFEPDGALMVGGPDYTAPPVATLVYDPANKRGNVLDLDITQDITRYYSDVTVLAQSHGTATAQGAHDIKATERDAYLLEHNIYRPLVVVDGDAENTAYAKKIARKTIADGQFAALTIKATVRGHRAYDDTGEGPVWQPGQRVRVVSVPDGVDDVYFLVGRALIGSEEDAQKTRLTLKPDGVWLPDVSKQKKGKEAKGTGRISNTWD